MHALLCQTDMAHNDSMCFGSWSFELSFIVVSLLERRWKVNV
jgi:hypothetical protein